MMSKPSIFIGSSSEGRELARAIRQGLVDDALVTMWDEGFFEVGGTFIETLVSSVSKFDFAVLVLTPDDHVNSRNAKKWGPRDNVIFELGLFIGSLGRERTFIVHSEGAAIKIPTDLAGVSTAKYYPHPDRNYLQQVGPACDIIRNSIRARGVSPRRATEQIGIISEEQRRQAIQLDDIRLLIDLVLPPYERQHLRGLSKENGPFSVEVDENYGYFEAELRHLLRLGLIERNPGVQLANLFKKPGSYDLKAYLKITDRGRDYLKLRERLKPSPDPVDVSAPALAGRGMRGSAAKAKPRSRREPFSATQQHDRSP